MSDNNFLSRFSDVIRQQGEYRESMTQVAIKNLQTELQGLEHRAKELHPNVLLERMENAALQMGCSDPRIGDLWKEMYVILKAEVLRRLQMISEA